MRHAHNSSHVWFITKMRAEAECLIVDSQNEHFLLRIEVLFAKKQQTLPTAKNIIYTQQVTGLLCTTNTSQKRLQADDRLLKHKVTREVESVFWHRKTTLPREIT